jgi:peptidoglycan-N-acetylglucosamine deacetylase
MIEEGHEVGNHTFDHIDCAHERNDDVIRAQIASTTSTIEHVVGVRPKLVRPPYGKAVCRVARLAAEAGVARTVLWSVEAWDWAATPADEISGRILADTTAGAIVLLHDGAPPGDTSRRDATVEALAQILPEFRSRGFELVTVSDLLRTATC